MNAPKTVTQAYLIGIGEGRALWQTFERQGIADLKTAREALANVEQCLAMGFSGDAREAMRGERDFWRLRVKRLAEMRAREGVEV